MIVPILNITVNDNNIQSAQLFTQKPRDRCHVFSMAYESRFFVNNIVPTEHREVTLEEFKTSVEESFFGKSGR